MLVEKADNYWITFSRAATALTDEDATRKGIDKDSTRAGTDVENSLILQ